MDILEVLWQAQIFLCTQNTKIRIVVTFLANCTTHCTISSSKVATKSLVKNIQNISNEVHEKYLEKRNVEPVAIIVVRESRERNKRKGGG